MVYWNLSILSPVHCERFSLVPARANFWSKSFCDFLVFTAAQCTPNFNISFLFNEIQLVIFCKRSSHVMFLSFVKAKSNLRSYEFRVTGTYTILQNHYIYIPNRLPRFLREFASNFMHYITDMMWYERF